MTSSTVVLVHGFGTSFDLTWVHNGWVDILGDTGRGVVGVDLLGHGSAPKPTDPTDYADMGSRVIAALDEAGHPANSGAVDGIGFSMGARTLIDVALDHPGRFRSLILSGVGANLFRRDDMSAVIDAIGSGDPGDNPALRYFSGLADLPGNNREALAACMGHSRGPLDADRLAELQIPVLVVLGADDFAGPADPLVDALPQATFVELARTDHAKTPKSFEFIDAALAFLDERDADS